MISTSPDRDQNKQKLPEPYQDLFKSSAEQQLNQEADPAWRENNLEYDLRTTEWILAKARGNKAYAQNLYAALCNNDFQKRDVMQILTDRLWHCSWRYAGGVVADMLQSGDYLDWYCSGILQHITDEEFHAMTKEQQEIYLYDKTHHVPEGVVTEEIEADLLTLGWNVIPYNKRDW